MSCNVFNTEKPLFRIIYKYIDKPKEKEIYYFVGNQNKQIKNILKKITNNEKLITSEKKEIQKTFKNDYTKINSYYKNKNKDKVYFIYDLIHLYDTVNIIKKKIFYYISKHYIDDDKKKYLNINNQLTWLEDNIILGFNYNNDKIIPTTITKIKIDNNFIDTNGERKPRSDIISNNNILIYDIIEKHKLNNKNYKITIISANDIVKYLKTKKKINDKLINGWLIKYFPKYSKLEIKICDSIYNNIKYKILQDKYINDLEINNKDIDNDYCSLTTIKIKTNKNNIKKKYNKDNINLNLDNIFFYITQKSKLFGKDIPFIKINNYRNEKSILIWKDIYNDKKKIKSWIGIVKDKEKDILKMKSGTVHILFKKFYKDIEYIDTNTNEKKQKSLYYTVTLLKEGNIIINISYSQIYKININNIIEILDDFGKLIDKLNNPSNVKLVDNISNFKLEKPEIKYINNKLITTEFTEIDYLNMIILNNNNINILKFGKLISLFKNIFRIDYALYDTITNLKFKYIKVSEYIDIYYIKKNIENLIAKGMSEHLIIKLLTDKFYITKSNAVDIFKEWKKKYDSDKYESTLFYDGISLNIINNKIEIKGLKNFFHFNNILEIINKCIYIINNSKLFYNNKNFINLFLKQNNKKNIIKNNMTNIDISDISDINNNNNIENIYNNNNNNNNINNYGSNNNNNNYYNGNNNNNNDKIDIIFNNYVNSNKIHSSLKLEYVCKENEMDKEYDTCKDLCNDNRYFLRRLQTFNPYLFNYKNKNKINLYSKACQRKSQPLILNDDPRKNKKYSKESFSNVLEYTVNNKKQYYICPDSWCPKCKMPFSLNELGGINKVETKRGINGKCIVAICPNSTDKDPHELFVRLKDGTFNPYSGFSTKMKHPNGHCMPCCFKKNQNNKKAKKYKYYKECIGEDVTYVKNKDDKIYILDYKIPIDNNRFGLLPDTLKRVFGKCETGYLKNNECYIKRGVINNINKSFLYCIADLISPDKKNILSVPNVINNIVKNKNLTNKLFNSLNGGTMDFKFKTSSKSGLENFKYYLQTSEYINYEYIWDLLQRPGILFEEGCNIIIFDEFNIRCPYKEDIDLFYDIYRPTMLIYTNNKYYEPIYRIKDINNNKIMNCIFNKSDKIIDNILQLIINKCRYKYDIDWHKILIEAEQIYNIKITNFNYEKEKSLFSVIKLLNTSKNKSFKIKTQILDNYNKVISIILNNDLYIPIRYSRLIMKYDFINISKREIVLNYTKTLELFKKVNKIINICDISKLNKIVNNNNEIIGLLLNTGRVILVKPSVFKKDKIPTIDMSYYSNANHYIETGLKNVNNREKYIVKKNYEDESYILFKLEFSYFINKNKDIKNNIKTIIHSTHKIFEKRNELHTIITDFINKYIIIVDKIDNINKYNIRNQRIICMECNNIKNKGTSITFNEFHCKKIGNLYKFMMRKNNLVNNKKNKLLYSSKIIEELLRYEIQRTEILNNTIPVIIDKSKIRFKDNLFLYINNSNTPDKFNKIINNFFNKKSTVLIKKNKTFNNVITKHINVDLDKFIVYKENFNYKTSIIELPIFWKKIFSDSYFIMNYNSNSVFIILQFIIGNKQLNIEDVKNTYINDINKHQKYLHNHLNVKSNILELYKTYGNNIFNKIKIIDQLKNIINDANYNGILIDLLLLAKYYKLNLIIIRNRQFKKNNFKFTYKIQNNNSDIYTIVIMKSKGKYFDFNILFKKNKIKPLFKLKYNTLPDDFIDVINK